MSLFVSIWLDGIVDYIDLLYIRQHQCIVNNNFGGNYGPLST